MTVAEGAPCGFGGTLKFSSSLKYLKNCNSCRALDVDDLILCLSSGFCPPDVHHQHHQDQVQPPGQARALPGHAVLSLPHRPQPGLRIPEPLLGRGGWIHPGISCGSVSGEERHRWGTKEGKLGQDLQLRSRVTRKMRRKRGRMTGRRGSIRRRRRGG